MSCPRCHAPTACNCTKCSGTRTVYEKTGVRPKWGGGFEDIFEWRTCPSCTDGRNSSCGWYNKNYPEEMRRREKEKRKREEEKRKQKEEKERKRKEWWDERKRRKEAGERDIPYIIYRFGQIALWVAVGGAVVILIAK